MRARRRWSVAGVLFLGAIGAVVVAVRSAPPAPAATDATAGPTARLVTPLWSARRVPTRAVGLARAARVQQVVASGPDGGNGCVAVGDGGTIRAGNRETEALIPGSTQKLFTALAALDTLGPEARYETRAVAAAAPSGGVVDTLFIVGGGDPVLQTDDYTAWKQTQPALAGNAHTSLETFADAIAHAGVTKVGRLVGDDSRYSDTRFLPVWDPLDAAHGEIGPLGALTVNSGFERFAGGTKVPSADPALLMLSRLRDALVARGVTVGDALRHGSAPSDGAVIATATSPPLKDVVGELLRSSDNTTAELVVLEVGHHATGRDGTTTADGVTVVRRQLDAADVPGAGLTIVDGSGLSHDDRATCAALVAALESEPPGLFDALAVAGRSGTLVASMRETTAEGRLHAKTGTLTGVAGLAGTFDTAAGLSFAILLNGNFSTASGATERNRIAVKIGDALTAPDPAAVVPAPGPPEPAVRPAPPVPAVRSAPPG